MRLVFLEAPCVCFLRGVKVVLRMHDSSDVFERVSIMMYEIDENGRLCFPFFFSRRGLVTYMTAVTCHGPDIQLNGVKETCARCRVNYGKILGLADVNSSSRCER